MSVGTRPPDGRRIAIDDEIVDRLLCGLLVAADVAVTQATEAVAAATTLGRELAERFGDRQPSRIEGLTEARSLYKSCGMDPSRHRPSSEALLRRAMRGKELYHINNVVDCCNLASLRFLLPIGLYDLSRLTGDVTLRLGRDDEAYAGIRKGPVHLAGRLGLFDDEGPFGSPTSDSARTRVTASTRGVLAVVMATAAYPPAAMARNLDVFAADLTRYCAAGSVWQAVLGAGAAS